MLTFLPVDLSKFRREPGVTEANSSAVKDRVDVSLSDLPVPSRESEALRLNSTRDPFLKILSRYLYCWLISVAVQTDPVNGSRLTMKMKTSMTLRIMTRGMIEEIKTAEDELGVVSLLEVAVVVVVTEDDVALCSIVVPLSLIPMAINAVGLLTIIATAGDIMANMGSAKNHMVDKDLDRNRLSRVPH